MYNARQVKTNIERMNQLPQPFRGYMKKLTILRSSEMRSWRLRHHAKSLDKPKNNDTISRKCKKHQDRLQQLGELNAKYRKKSIDTSPANTLITFPPIMTQQYEPLMTFQLDRSHLDITLADEPNSISETMKIPRMTSAEGSRRYSEMKKKKKKKV